MDSGTSNDGGGSQNKGTEGNGGTSRKRNSTSSKQPSFKAADCYLTPMERRVAALQLKLKLNQSKKRGRPRTKNPSPPPPPPAKPKRLQRKALGIKTAKNTKAPAPDSRKRLSTARQKRACALDMPDVSQLPTSPILVEIEEEGTSPPAPIPLRNQGPFPFTKRSQSPPPCQGGGGGNLHHLPVPVPLPRQQDVVVLSPDSEKAPSSSVRHRKKQSSDQRKIWQEKEERDDEELKETRRLMTVTAGRLKNLLKMPKAFKWVIFEWFYSDIDRALFEVENDFETCLRKCFPSLKVRQMRRAEWVKIRGMMGKPRRSSACFFAEEREQLALAREKIRMMQRGSKVGSKWGVWKCLPDEIPMVLTIGTTVLARVRKPLDGLFLGTVEGVGHSNNTYRIAFRRADLGALSIQDFEVRAQSPPDTISTAKLCMEIPRLVSGKDAFKFKFRNATLLQDNFGEGLPKSDFPIDSMFGRFPVRCLELMVRQSKLLRAKRGKVGELRELNLEAEKMITYGKTYPEKFRRSYASCIVELKRINEGLEKVMRVIQVYMEEISNDVIQDGGASSSSAGKMVFAEKVKENADKEAGNLVSKCNLPVGVNNPKIKELVKNLASLMLQAKALGTANGERKPFELESMRQTVDEVRGSLEDGNLRAFENKVDIPLSRLIAGLCMKPKVGEDKTD